VEAAIYFAKLAFSLTLFAIDRRKQGKRFRWDRSESDSQAIDSTLNRYRFPGITLQPSPTPGGGTNRTIENALWFSSF